MTGILLVCVSVLLSTGTAEARARHSMPSAIPEAAEIGFRSAQRGSNRVSLIGDWEYAASAALLDEFMIDTSITYVGDLWDQVNPSVAFGTDNFLVVWGDDGGVDIRGSRIDTSGIVLDTFGIPVCTAPGNQGVATVAFDGTNYLVAWTDFRNDSVDSDIYGARVSESGAPIDSLGIAISVAAGRQHSPSLAFDGTNYLVVWSDGRNGPNYDIYGARLDTDGNVLDTLGIAVSVDSVSKGSPVVDFGESRYLVVWTEYHSGTGLDLYGTRIDMMGNVLDTTGFAISRSVGSQEHPSLASDGTKYFVVWSDYRNGIDRDIYGARVDTSGSVLDTLGIGISTEPDEQSYPSIDFDGANYLAVWEEFPDGICAVRVDTSGAVLGPSEIITPQLAMFPSLACGGPIHLAVWQEWGLSADIHGVRIDTSGVAIDTSDILITMSANLQSYSSVSFNGSNYLVVWMDARSGSESDVYGSRVTESGVVLDPSGILISAAHAYQLVYPFSVVFDGSNQLVVWGGFDLVSWTTSIYGSRVDPSGLVLDSSGIAICTTGYERFSGSAASGGDGCLVVWDEYHSLTGRDIYAARLDTSGTVLDPSGIVISAADDRQGAPSVCCDGANYFVVWADWRSWPSETDIYGARVDMSGAVLDPTGIPISTLPEWEYYPSVAFDGTNYFVVWEIDHTGSSSDISGARVDTDGTVLDVPGISICDATNEQSYPCVVFDGTDYLVVWQDYRSGTDWDVYGARVTTSGGVLDPSGLELINQPYDRLEPSVSSGSSGQMLLTYYGFTAEPFNTYRTFGALYTGVGTEEYSPFSNVRRSVFVLLQNRPNPFHTSTVIKYSLPVTTEASLSIYDITGRLVETLENETKQSGMHQVRWDRKTNPSGVYFYRLKAGEFISTKKMVVVE